MIRVLAIDDEINILSSLKDRVTLSKQPINFIRFGIDINPISRKQEIFEAEVSEAFIEFIKKGNGRDFDIILMDFSMPRKNAHAILYELREEKLPPIIMMSADSNAVHNHILSLLQNGYAKRYIYKNSPLFADELRIYAINVTEEYYNHQMIKLLNRLNQEDFYNFETFAQKLADTFMKQLPDTYVVIRKYDSKNKILIKANDLEGVKLPEIIDSRYDTRLFDVLESIEGYKIDNHFDLRNYPTLQKVFGDSIKSLIIRIGKQNSPQGIINIFKKDTYFALQTFLIKSIKSSIDNLNANITHIELTHTFNKVLRFLSDIINESNEEEILQKYTSMVHELFNRNHSKNKTTLKILKPGKDILELLCEGDCEINRELYQPKITDNSISSTVFMENITILTYDTRDMDEVWSRFREVFKKIHGFDIDESKKIKFYQTTDIEMRSSLCVPISSFSRDKYGAVFGIINLESEIVNYYTIKEMKLLFNMSQVVGARIESIRNQKLLNGLLQSSITLDYKDKLNLIRDILKEYLGFFSLTIFRENQNRRLEIEDIMIEDNEINSVEVTQKYNKILKNSKKFQKTALYQTQQYFRDGYSLFYLPNIHEAPVHIIGKFKDGILETNTKDNSDKKFKIYHQDFFDVKSYYAQAIRYKQQLMGILVLEFQVSNPMINHNLQIIEKVTELLGVIYLNIYDKIQNEMIDLYIRDYVRNFQSNFRHIVYNHYKDIEYLLDKDKNFWLDS